MGTEGRSGGCATKEEGRSGEGRRVGRKWKKVEG